MSFVKYEPKGNIAYLIIDREKALNALNSQVLADLDAALDAVDLSEIRCLIVRGAGEKSCASSKRSPSRRSRRWAAMPSAAAASSR